jgi:hypothetical protein
MTEAARGIDVGIGTMDYFFVVKGDGQLMKRNVSVS